MFDFIWYLLGSTDPEKERRVSLVKNRLKTYIIRKRFLQQRDATIAIQSFYRYYKIKNNIQKRLKDDGCQIIEEQFVLKKKWLLKLRSDLYEYISFIDTRLKMD